MTEALVTDPNHESPDVIDQRSTDDPSRFDPPPGVPSVKPGILLPATLPLGWTIGPDGGLVPPPETPVTTIPEVVITASPPARAGNNTGVVLLLLVGAAALFVATRAAR